MSQPPSQEPDWANQKSIATERNIDRFIEDVGGIRIDTILQHVKHKNADYLFDEQKIIIELKIIETEFGETKSFADKFTKLIEKTKSSFTQDQLMRQDRAVRRFFNDGLKRIYRDPIGQIVKKANRQIRETRAALDRLDLRGVLWIVNDSFKEMPVEFVMEFIASNLRGKNSEIRAFTYVTNHYVDIPGSDVANLVWSPSYADAEAEPDIRDFLNWLGYEWGNFLEKEIGPFVQSLRGDDLSLEGARPITDAVLKQRTPLKF